MVLLPKLVSLLPGFSMEGLSNERPGLAWIFSSEIWTLCVLMFLLS